ncbi:MAG: DUF6776 family protein [Halieaceae bacterium]|jgi:hypothetical protein|nr:DUF6776 family protein [Halieaceae bacterium]
MMSRSVVVQDDPRARRRRRVLSGLAMLALFLAGLAAGGWGRVSLGIESVWENRRLRQTVVDQARQLDELRQRYSDNLTRSEIDAAALELVRQELAQQRETIAELEKGIQFYKGLMAPGDTVDGVSVHSVDFKPGANGRRYQFRVLVQQSSRKHELLSGTLAVTLHGTENDVPVSYELFQLSEQVPDQEIRLRFKYFQAIDGEIVLPEDFVPLTISTRTQSTRPRSASIEQEFPWAAQERISHARQ